MTSTVSTEGEEFHATRTVRRVNIVTGEHRELSVSQRAIVTIVIGNHFWAHHDKGVR